ncbi:MAG: LapA family protein [Deltaproteobacteria bacterium]|nr:LapA family protein [Deltaproteobacteria bacterium]
MVRTKLITALVLVAVVIVVVFQNTQPVETKFLFVTMTMPRATLLAITLLIGIAVGILVAFGLSGKKTKKD